jgi:hypothetical protein
VLRGLLTEILGAKDLHPVGEKPQPKGGGRKSGAERQKAECPSLEFTSRSQNRKQGRVPTNSPVTRKEGYLMKHKFRGKSLENMLMLRSLVTNSTAVGATSS